MKVRDLLAGRDPETVTIDPGSSIQELVGALASRRIGAVAVVDGDGQLVGMISERDVAYGLVEYGGEILKKSVSDLMTEDVITSELESDIADVVFLMSSHSIRHLPVLDGNDLSGMVSLRDALDLRVAELDAENETIRQQFAESEKV